MVGDCVSGRGGVFQERGSAENCLQTRLDKNMRELHGGKERPSFKLQGLQLISCSNAGSGQSVSDAWRDMLHCLRDMQKVLFVGAAS